MSSARALIVKIEKVAKNRVVVEYVDGKRAIFDLVKTLDGSKVYLVSWVDENGKIIGTEVIPP